VKGSKKQLENEAQLNRSGKAKPAASAGLKTQKPDFLV
jgi:hypothetical protein